MRAELLSGDNGICRLSLSAETESEERTLRGLWLRRAKVNALTVKPPPVTLEVIFAEIKEEKE